MTQIDGLVHSKTTVCSSKSVNFGDQNRRFTPFISQKWNSAIDTLTSRHRNKAVAKGLKTVILACQEFRLRINTRDRFSLSLNQEFYATLFFKLQIPLIYTVFIEIPKYILRFAQLFVSLQALTCCQTK